MIAILSRRFHLKLFAIVLLTFITFTNAMAQDRPAIAAASNIKFALDDIAQVFTQQTGKSVRISYGSSGNFVAQIKHGAPFQLFLSADIRYINQMQQQGLVTEAPVTYAVGKLALAAAKSSPLILDPDLTGVESLIKQGKMGRFAIANPAHAPYGERAEEYLEHYQLWHSMKSHLVYGENASQAVQFVLSGVTLGGIVPLSLVKTAQFQDKVNFIELPSDYHQSLAQDMVLLPNASQVAHDFYQFVLSKSAGVIFEKYGFALPEANLIARSAD